MSDIHFPVIYHICEMESWPSILFHQDEIIKLTGSNFAKDFIFKIFYPEFRNIGFYSHWIRLFISYFFFNLF